MVIAPTCNHGLVGLKPDEVRVLLVAGRVTDEPLWY